ncbi:MAG: hypothetical protein WBF06_00340 [Candidatus Acidiferrales bacterium]
MKMFAAAFCVLCGGMLFSAAAQGTSPTPERPKFKIEIRATGEKGQGPSFAVTNLTGKTVTACVFEQSYASQAARKTTTVWDALMQGNTPNNTPIEPGQTVLRPLSPMMGNALPDKVEVVAGVWADGESFGPPKWASNIFNNRALIASQNEDAAAILQRGLDQNWNRNQYQQAFSGEPDSGPVYIVRTALTATQQTGQTPQEFTHTMQFLLQSFKQQADKLRKSIPH